jgi:hypothetical protein
MQLPPITNTKHGDRSITSEYEIDRDDTAESVLFVGLTTQHSKGSKSIFSTLRVVKRQAEHDGDRTYFVESFWAFEFVRIGSARPCARYSATQLNDGHSLARMMLSDMAERDDSEIVKSFSVALDQFTA